MFFPSVRDALPNLTPISAVVHTCGKSHFNTSSFLPVIQQGLSTEACLMWLALQEKKTRAKLIQTAMFY